eukprot:TRINITY_DN5654_c0_g1_i3.p1 TRINITY_DN5654_c0_g1~~TRINITY_DN5654_c0_g1_i3.p1  ORF type:complete len:1726 (-),score=410.38 TRINITY_DN5654_c0_g1_i3:74-5251(-)
MDLGIWLRVEQNGLYWEVIIEPLMTFENGCPLPLKFGNKNLFRSTDRSLTVAAPIQHLPSSHIPLTSLAMSSATGNGNSITPSSSSTKHNNINSASFSVDLHDFEFESCEHCRPKDTDIESKSHFSGISQLTSKCSPSSVVFHPLFHKKDFDIPLNDETWNSVDVSWKDMNSWAISLPLCCSKSPLVSRCRLQTRSLPVRSMNTPRRLHFRIHLQQQFLNDQPSSYRLRVCPVLRVLNHSRNTCKVLLRSRDLSLSEHGAFSPTAMTSASVVGGPESVSPFSPAPVHTQIESPAHQSKWASSAIQLELPPFKARSFFNNPARLGFIQSISNEQEEQKRMFAQKQEKKKKQRFKIDVPSMPNEEPLPDFVSSNCECKISGCWSKPHTLSNSICNDDNVAEDVDNYPFMCATTNESAPTGYVASQYRTIPSSSGIGVSIQRPLIIRNETGTPLQLLLSTTVQPKHSTRTPEHPRLIPKCKNLSSSAKWIDMLHNPKKRRDNGGFSEFLKNEVAKDKNSYIDSGHGLTLNEFYSRIAPRSSVSRTKFLPTDTYAFEDLPWNRVFMMPMTGAIGTKTQSERCFVDLPLTKEEADKINSQSPFANQTLPTKNILPCIFTTHPIAETGQVVLLIRPRVVIINTTGHDMLVADAGFNSSVRQKSLCAHVRCNKNDESIPVPLSTTSASLPPPAGMTKIEHEIGRRRAKKYVTGTDTICSKFRLTFFEPNALFNPTEPMIRSRRPAGSCDSAWDWSQLLEIEPIESSMDGDESQPFVSRRIIHFNLSHQDFGNILLKCETVLCFATQQFSVIISQSLPQVTFLNHSSHMLRLQTGSIEIPPTVNTENYVSGYVLPPHSRCELMKDMIFDNPSRSGIMSVLPCNQGQAFPIDRWLPQDDLPFDNGVISSMSESWVMLFSYRSHKTRSEISSVPIRCVRGRHIVDKDLSLVAQVSSNGPCMTIDIIDDNCIDVIPHQESYMPMSMRFNVDSCIVRLFDSGNFHSMENKNTTASDSDNSNFDQSSSFLLSQHDASADFDLPPSSSIATESVSTSRNKRPSIAEKTNSKGTARDSGDVVHLENIDVSEKPKVLISKSICAIQITDLCGSLNQSLKKMRYLTEEYEDEETKMEDFAEHKRNFYDSVMVLNVNMKELRLEENIDDNSDVEFAGCIVLADSSNEKSAVSLLATLTSARDSNLPMNIQRCRISMGDACSVSLEDSLIWKLQTAAVDIGAAIESVSTAFSNADCLNQDSVFSNPLEIIPIPVCHSPEFVSARLGPLLWSEAANVKSLDDLYFVEDLDVSYLSILVSFRLTKPVFVSTSEAPITLAPVKVSQELLTSEKLMSRVSRGFVQDAVLRSPLLVGSLQVLGNPTGLLRSVGSGISSIWKQPAAAIRNGKGVTRAFVAVFKGASDALSTVSMSTLSSIQGLTLSIGRNMDLISQAAVSTSTNDENQIPIRSFVENISKNEELEQKDEMKPLIQSRGLFGGLKSGLSAFGSGLKGMGSMFSEPIRRGKESNWSVNEVATGVGTGIASAVTAPVGGVFNLMAETTRGVMESSGLSSKHSSPNIIKQVPLLWKSVNLKRTLMMRSDCFNSNTFLVTSANPGDISPYLLFCYNNHSFSDYKKERKNPSKHSKHQILDLHKIIDKKMGNLMTGDDNDVNSSVSSLSPTMMIDSINQFHVGNFDNSIILELVRMEGRKQKMGSLELKFEDARKAMEFLTIISFYGPSKKGDDKI